MPRILSLNPHFGWSPAWREQTTSVASLIPSWHQKSTVAKAISLLRVAGRFDVILFYHDIRLPAAFGLLNCLRRAGPRLVFQEMFYHRTPGNRKLGLIKTLRHIMNYINHWVVARSMDAVIVHTSAETETYAHLFDTPPSRFKFIPYFHYGEAADRAFGNSNRPEAGYVLAAGRHRDFPCFIRALADTPWRGVIVAGASDRDEIGESLPPNIRAYYEVGGHEYDDFMAGAAVVVIPLYASKWEGSHGHIAMLTAALMRKPIVAARAFHLRDYIAADEVLQYEPGDASELRRRIASLMNDPDLRFRQAENCYRSAREKFTVERYVTELLETCRVAGATPGAGGSFRATNR